ncbi:MAG: hypothetical protein U5L01_00895 [Rheinheimera sp.]|nr:hypothetical protein [Rheinheimera sp.]
MVPWPLWKKAQQVPDALAIYADVFSYIYLGWGWCRGIYVCHDTDFKPSNSYCSRENAISVMACPTAEILGKFVELQPRTVN